MARIAAAPHPVDKAVGARVTTRRLALGRTQNDLARAIGVSFQQIQKYESGANRISTSRLWEIASALDAPMTFFFEDLAAVAASRVAPVAMTAWGRDLMALEPGLTAAKRKLVLTMAQQLADRDAVAV